MRWNVYGTDASTGQDVTLAVEETEATYAVQTALSKRILVTHVTPESRRRIQRALWPLVCAAAVVAVPLVAGLYASNESLRDNLRQAQQERGRLADSLGQAQGMLGELQKSGNLESGAQAQAQKLAEQLAMTSSRMSSSEQELSKAHTQLDVMERAAAKVPDLQNQIAALTGQLAGVQTQSGLLREQVAMQKRRLQDLEAQPSPESQVAQRAAQLEKTNHELASQIDELRGQLLVAAARPADPPEIPQSAVPVTGTRWALRTSYDAAADFLRLKFDHESLLTTPTSDGAAVSSGAWAENAATLKFTHDRQKERVYSATLAISLASDAPKEKLAENLKLAAAFVTTFVPSFKDPQPTLTSAVNQLAAKDDRQRLLFVADDGRLVIWGNGAGMFTLRIESPRQDGD